MPRSCIVGMAAIGIVVALLPGAAQQPPAPAPAPSTEQPQLPTFRTGANLVRVDVTVLDHRGQPVPALGPTDFLIEEDGVAQKVTSLKYIEANGLQAAGDDTSLPIRSPQHAAAEAARDDVRVFLIFWDEYSIDQFASTLRAREALLRLVTTAFKPTDLVALMDQLTPTSAIRFTRDFRDLSLDVKKLHGRLGLFFPTRSAVEDMQISNGSDVRRLRAEVSLSALKAAVVYLGTLREGRKTVIFVSEGIRGLGSDARTVMADVVRAANESNTAIYTVDPRGLTARGASDSLFQLADNTGGRTVVNTNGLDGALRQVVSEASAFYLLGYSSVRNPADGRFHQIKVRVDRPGLDVRARRGYWAPSDRAVEEARVAAAAATPPDEVAVALAALTPATSRHVLDLWAGVVTGAQGLPVLSVAWTPRTGSAAGADRPATVAVSATSDAETFEYEGKIDELRTAFPARAGTFRVLLTVRDSDQRIIDTETRSVTIPDPAAGQSTAAAGTPGASLPAPGFVWGTPVLLRARSPLEMRAIGSDVNAPPYAGRNFARTDRLVVRVALFGDSQGATVTSRLLGRQGQQLVTLPIAPLAGRVGTWQIDLPLQSLAAGDYVIGIAGARDGRRVERFVAIRVGG